MIAPSKHHKRWDPPRPEERRARLRPRSVQGKTIGYVAAGLRARKISPDQLPIDVIVRNGETIALNSSMSCATTARGRRGRLS